MHDFSVFRTVSGPYDVPLDDPKPRFGQQRRKNRPRPCCRSPFLYNFTLDFKGNILKRFKATPWHIFRVCWMPPPQAQLRPMPCSCAHPSATMCTAAVCSTFFSTCPHLSLIATSAATWRAARSDALEKQKLGSNFAEGGIPFSVKVPAQGRCGAIGRRASPRSSHALCSFSAPRYPCPLTSPSSARAQVCCSGPVWAR